MLHSTSETHSSFWADWDLTIAQVVTIAGKRWETTSSSEYLGYLCHQKILATNSLRYNINNDTWTEWSIRIPQRQIFLSAAFLCPDECELCTWGAWSAWETCSVTCGGGTQERNRTITQPALNNGTDCAGNDTETQSCNTNGCPGNVKYQSK